MSKHYYAKEWPCGLAVREVHHRHGSNPITQNVVNVFVFDTAGQRDRWVDDWRAPSYCPSAFAEAVSAKDEDVRRIQRDELETFFTEEEVAV